MNYRQLAGVTMGEYELHELLADEARFVATYRAHQARLKRDVAVQVLSEAYEDWREGFVRAAEIIASLEHSNIVPIHHVDTFHQFTYIVTRLMPGGSLRRRLKSGAMPLREGVTVARQIASALEFTHSRGMTHGDPSVANIVFDGWGTAYIADFHVAGAFQFRREDMMGTPVYCSGERWTTGPSPLTDQYALACVTYHMLTGTLPFDGGMMEVIHKHTNDLPPPAHERNPDIPPTVSNVLLRALSKQPDARYPTVTDFARELERATAARPGHVFLSYSRDDGEYAARLIERLHESGFEVWSDASIDYGDQWFSAIDTAIRNGAAFVLLMTPAALASEWVPKEILLAKRYKKPILPLLLAGEEFPIVIDLQAADVRDGAMPDADFHRRLRRAVFSDL